MHGGHACEVANVTAKRAMAMTAEALTKKGSKQADDEAPTPLEAALLARLPGAPAAHAPPPSSPHAPERTARSPALCEAVCALSPLELMAHTARRAHSEFKEMDAMSERHELLFPDDGSEL